MPYIKVNIAKIKNYSSEIASFSTSVRSIKENFNDYAGRLDWDVKSSSNINNRINAISRELETELSSCNKMQSFLLTAAGKYDELEGNRTGSSSEFAASHTIGGAGRGGGGGGGGHVRQFDVEKGFSEYAKGDVTFGTLPASESDDDPTWVRRLRMALSAGGFGLGAYEFVSDLRKSGDLAKQITFTYKNGKMFLEGYKKGQGFTSRYNFSTWIKKGANNKVGIGAGAEKLFNKLDIASMVVDGGIEVLDAGMRIYDVWTDENKSTEKKICDTVANVYCTTASIAIDVGGKIVGKAASGAVAAACCAIPVVGPVIGAVAGAVTGYVVDQAFGIVADTMTSEAVVSRVSDATENVVGAVKSGVSAVSDAVKAIHEADTIGGKAIKTAEAVGTAVAETAKVAVTAAVESFKTTATVVAETAKNVGKAIGNLFKGW